MKIGIITVYDGVSNLGSYLQAYAMQHTLQSLGHEVFFLEKKSVGQSIRDHISKLNPKRAFFLRLHSAWNYLFDSRSFSFIQPAKATDKLDCLLFGSDELWNMDNPYFADKLFWGTGFENIPKISYAASVGAMTEETLAKYKFLTQGIHTFNTILVRDEYTREMIGKLVGCSNLPMVCDPTFLVDKAVLQKPLHLPNKPYILVYSYGLDQPMIENITRFAKEKNLSIISAHFWHHFCDKTICCRPTEFGSLMAGAEYVFTSTFHGAVFSMLNHTKCCILPVRSKVKEVVYQMGQETRLIDANADYETFSSTISRPFNSTAFENILHRYRHESMEQLKAALKCLEE